MLKYIIFGAVVLSLQASMASENFCEDHRKKAYYVKAIGEATVGKLDVEMIEVIADLGNNKSAVVTCFRDRIISRNQAEISAKIVDNTKIFLPVLFNADSEEAVVVGMNYQTSRVLVDTKSIIPARKYSVRFDEHLN